VSQTFPILRFLHVIVAVFMAAPLYLLIVSNERGRLGPPLNFRLERYMENIIKGQPKRCYVYLTVLLLTGLALRGFNLGLLLTNWVLGLKTVLLIALFGLITYVHTQIQPRLEELLEKVPEGDGAKEDVAKEMMALRIKRKKIGSVCLFLVLTTIVLGVSLVTMMSTQVIALIAGLAAVFSWRVYTSLLPFGLV
jgi:hypothetical protein